MVSRGVDRAPDVGVKQRVIMGFSKQAQDADRSQRKAFSGAATAHRLTVRRGATEAPASALRFASSPA